jgi:hypothetical protein
MVLQQVLQDWQDQARQGWFGRTLTVDLRSRLPDIWIAAHPEHFLQYRRDEAEATAIARRRCRERRRAQAREHSRSP